MLLYPSLHHPYTAGALFQKLHESFFIRDIPVHYVVTVEIRALIDGIAKEQVVLFEIKEMKFSIALAVAAAAGRIGNEKIITKQKIFVQTCAAAFIPPFDILFEEFIRADNMRIQ